MERLSRKIVYGISIDETNVLLLSTNELFSRFSLLRLLNSDWLVHEGTRKPFKFSQLIG